MTDKPRSLVTPDTSTDEATRERLRDPAHPERPMIMLEHAQVWCPRHGEPFRTKWPQGALIFQVRGFTEVATQEFAIEIDRLGLTFEQGVEHLLSSVPICCRLPTDKLLALYAEAGIGEERTCDVCGERALGAPYRVRLDDGVHELAHACFSCVCTRMVSTRS